MKQAELVDTVESTEYDEYDFLTRGSVLSVTKADEESNTWIKDVGTQIYRLIQFDASQGKFVEVYPNQGHTLEEGSIHVSLYKN